MYTITDRHGTLSYPEVRYMYTIIQRHGTLSYPEVGHMYKTLKDIAPYLSGGEIHIYNHSKT